jgi:hypothetical protein
MQEIDMSLDGDILTIRLDLSQKVGQSKTGKSQIIYSSRGPQRVCGKDGEHGQVRVSMNVFSIIPKANRGSAQGGEEDFGGGDENLLDYLGR